VGLVVGVLALQGAFASHQQRLAELGVLTRQVRTPATSSGVDALVMPGGESTTMSKLLSEQRPVRRDRRPGSTTACRCSARAPA
jgi:glutamine amidotransferase PdxT